MAFDTPTPLQQTPRPLAAVELVLVAARSLSDAEHDQLLKGLAEQRLARLAEESSQADSALRALAIAALRYGPELTSGDYKAARVELAAEGVEILPLTRVIACFGTWVEAKEALTLSEQLTPEAISARMQKRRKLGKVWRYTEETLAATMRNACKHYGRPPQVAEFAWWRDWELRRVRATGDEFTHLPSATPYRRRYGSWEAALLHFGYAPEEVKRRLERSSA